MKKTYGKIVPGLKIDNEPINYPVVNERVVRATAGIMFVFGVSAFFPMFLTQNGILIKTIVPFFFLEFLLKVVGGPQYSIFGILGKFLVRNQKPEYVGAIQKRFAWGMGLVTASIMIILLFGFGIQSWATRAICLFCLTVMWMESTLGICVGCKIYSFLLRKKLIPEPDVRPACPGGVCKIKK